MQASLVFAAHGCLDVCQSVGCHHAFERQPSVAVMFEKLRNKGGRIAVPLDDPNDPVAKGPKLVDFGRKEITGLGHADQSEHAAKACREIRMIGGIEYVCCTELHGKIAPRGMRLDDDDRCAALNLGGHFSTQPRPNHRRQ